MDKFQHHVDPLLQSRLEKKVEHFFSPLNNFIKKQTTAALLLIIATALALIFANLPGTDPIKLIAELELGLSLGNKNLVLSIKEWVNNGLVTLFFFLIGLEVKREIFAGSLQDFRKVCLIMIAASGGMIVPAFFYWIFNHETEAIHGWAIPMATDTAFAIGALVLFKNRISPEVPIFLTALAIFDDIGSIIIIAIFYTTQLHYLALIKAIVILAIMFITNRMGIRKGWVFIILGVMLWWYIYSSGIHSTLAGLLAAFAVPARTQLSQSGFIKKMQKLLRNFEDKIDIKISMLGSVGQNSITREIDKAVKASSTPLQRWERLFANPVSIIVLPLFALFNAGILLSADNIMNALESSVTIGIIIGLVLGKPIGIVLFSFLGIWLKVGALPKGMSVYELIGVGILEGIGFTMSIFITFLSFVNYPALIEPAKIGIILSSLISAIIAIIWFYAITKYHLFKKATM